MRIALFHEVQPGGAKRAVIEFGRELAKNHVVDLYYTEARRDDDVKNIFKTVFYYHFSPKVWKGKNWKVKLYKDTFELIKLYFLHKAIATKINAKQYDIVFLSPSRFTQAPFLLRFLVTKKVYYSQESLRMIYEREFGIPATWSFSRKAYERINRRMRKGIDKSNLSYSNLILANSKFSQQNLKNAYNRESTVCYMGVDTNVFMPSLIKKEYDLLYVGALDEVDGYGLLKDAIRMMKKKPVVRELLREKHWVRSQQDMAQLYKKASVVVCLSRNEPFGLIPLEAMACGIPVIAVAEGGYRETVIDKETGYLIRRDAKRLAQKIDLLLANKKLYLRFSEKSREEAVGKWRWSVATRRLETIMENILNR